MTSGPASTQPVTVRSTELLPAVADPVRTHSLPE